MTSASGIRLECFARARVACLRHSIVIIDVTQHRRLINDFDDDAKFVRARSRRCRPTRRQASRSNTRHDACRRRRPRVKWMKSRRHCRHRLRHRCRPDLPPGVLGNLYASSGRQLERLMWPGGSAMDKQSPKSGLTGE